VADRHGSKYLIQTGWAVPGLASRDVSLEEVLEIICSGISGSTIAEITILEAKQHDPAVAVHQFACHGSAIPYRELGGPRQDSYQHRVVNRIDSTKSDQRWPEFCKSAVALGVHAVLSFPLVLARRSLGTLSIYSDAEAGFDDRSAGGAALFALLASTIVGPSVSGKPAPNVINS
jgi:hypothetical protein